MVGPVAMAYELVSQARDNTENLDLSLILSAATKVARQCQQPFGQQMQNTSPK